MERNMKYLVAVALLAVLAVVFGLAGTSARTSESVSPQQSSSSSDSVAHFQNPPTYDSDWVDITAERGQHFNITHDLNSTDVTVDITGKATPEGGFHQIHFGGTSYSPGWCQMHGGQSGDGGTSIVQTGDGGYAIAGITYSYGAGGHDSWLVKTDGAGNIQWNRTYGGTNSDYGQAIVQVEDRGYAIACRTDSFGAGGFDFWLVKTDSAGNIQWNQTYGGKNDDAAYSLAQTSDKGYAMVGCTRSTGAGSNDFWLVKTDSVGNMQWNRTYGGVDSEQGNCVIQASNRGYALAGSGYDLWLIKTEVESGVAWTDSTENTITLYRGATDPYWNYVRVRIWVIEEPTWMFGDINQDGVVDVQDLYILSQNYGKTFSLLSLTGIIAIAGLHTYNKRKQPKQAKSHNPFSLRFLGFAKGFATSIFAILQNKQCCAYCARIVLNDSLRLSWPTKAFLVE